MVKVEVDPRQARHLLSARPAVLVTSVGSDGKPNIIPIGWSMPTSFNPPLVAISVGVRRFSHELIEDSQEFVVNLPSKDMRDKIMVCGSCSGRRVNKFERAGLTPLKSLRVRPPRIKECVGHIECKLVDKLRTGDHTIFVGEVVASSADEEVLDESGTPSPLLAEPIYHLGGSDFGTLESKAKTPKH